MKAQFSLEFAIALFFAVAFFSALYIFNINQKVFVSSVCFSSKMGEYANSLASKIDTTASIDGFSSSFYIPQKIGDTNCSFTISNSSIVVECENKTTISSIHISDIIYNSSSPPFTLNSGYYTVKNRDGLVIIDET